MFFDIIMTGAHLIVGLGAFIWLLEWLGKDMS